MPTVRTTLRPDEPIEVGEAEALDLKRQGLLAEDPEPPAAPAPVIKKAAMAAATKEG